MVRSYHAIAVPLVLAASGGGGSSDTGGNFLVKPEFGPMIFTLIAFGITLWILGKYAFPRIAQALDKRQRAIEDAIDHAEHTREEADKLLAEYRERLKEAREQAEEIVVRARRAGDDHERQTLEEAKAKRDELLEQTRNDIQAETRRAIQDIRREVADLTIQATEKVTRRSLTEDDQRWLVDEALGELDFSALSGNGKDEGS